MTFYVEKKLALGPISFGVSPTRRTNAPDDDASLSTGPAGEFIRRRTEGFFFGGQDRFTGPALPTTPTIASKPFWESLKGGPPGRTYGFFALLIFGFIFVLLGLAVIGTKGPQGWVEVILGLAMIAQLADGVDIDTPPSGGTVVRLRFRVDGDGDAAT